LNKDLESAHSTIKALEVSFRDLVSKFKLTGRASWNKCPITTNKEDLSGDDKSSGWFGSKVAFGGPGSPWFG